MIAALFVWRFASSARPAEELDRREASLLLLLGSLAFITRMDTILFYAPPLAWVVLAQARRRGVRALGPLLLALLPAVAWLLWSTFYYGFPFPNTAYAKASHIGVPLADRVVRGLTYLKTSVQWDLASHAVLVLATVLAVRRRHWRALALLAGVALYLVYVVTTAASATHMAGRFVAVPFFVGFLLALELMESRLMGAVVAGCAVLFMLVNPVAPLKLGTAQYRSPIPLDRSCLDTNFYVHMEGAALANQRPGVTLPAHQWYFAGEAFRDHPLWLHVGGAYGHQAIGYFGFAAGPKKHIIDYLALADAFLARLPACNTSRPEFWKSGHFYRRPPAGYVASLRRGKNLLRDPGLRQYFRRLQTVIRGPLWSGERLAEIIAFNLGRHDHLLQRHRQAVRQHYSKGTCKPEVHRGAVGLIR